MTVYFSGPHGAGKSSLIRQVCEYSTACVAYPDRLKFAKVQEPCLRHRAKLAKYFQEYCDQLDFCGKNQGKIVLADRCVYDNFVYGRVFVCLGWMAASEQALCEDIASKLFPELPDYLVVLNPPFSELKSRIESRWRNTGEKKWREEDLEYLRAAGEQFGNLPSYFAGKQLLYISDSVPVAREAELVLDWMEKNALLPQAGLEQVVLQSVA